MRQRLEHLAVIEASASNSGSDFWADTRLDRWLVDWALRHGKERTARKIAREKSLEVRLDFVANYCRWSNWWSRR